MSDFIKFRDAVTKNLKAMEITGLFETNVDKDVMWELYLDSFPAGTNNVFRERREYDCTCCRQFIKTVGHLVTITGGKIVSVWDDIPEISYYGPVVDALSQFVRESTVKDIFLHESNVVGSKKTLSSNAGSLESWDHFYHTLDRKYVARKDTIPTKRGQVNSAHAVFSRGLKELTLDAVDTVLELIAQNSLYRGADYRSALEAFRDMKVQAEASGDVDLYAWGIMSGNVGNAVTGIRNTAIGTLLIDLSEGVKDLEAAVSSFERMVAPSNYKRPTALITPRMIADAQKTVETLGIEGSLQRRHASPEDITVNNLLFVDRSSKKLHEKGVFDILKEETRQVPSTSKKTKISLDDFVQDVLPTATSIELLFERKNINNLMSLIAPAVESSPNIMKWSNNFTWSYMGEMADSVKDRVKAAGGRIDGKLRVSLGWSNKDDLDLHVVEPGGNRIYYGSRNSRVSDGALDVDMHVSSPYVADPVENVIWPSKPREGKYTIRIVNFTKRDSSNQGYRVEVECNGETFVAERSANPRSKDEGVFQFTYKEATGVTMDKDFASDSMPGEPVWGIRPNTFVPVDMVMFSPNYWDGEGVGNKHLFLMLRDCVNDGTVRGFYNEFLKEDLNKHRKVFEVLADKMKPEACINQLSGVGFSTTARNEFTVRVKGAHERVMTVIV